MKLVARGKMKRKDGKLANLSDIQRVADQIAEKFQPQKIILFGSYAYGKPTPDSDVDLLVIMNTKRGRLRPSVRIRLAVDHLFPMDLIVRTPREIEKRIKLGDFFLQEVISKGRVLYESTHNRVDRKG